MIAHHHIYSNEASQFLQGDRSHCALLLLNIQIALENNVFLDGPIKELHEEINWSSAALEFLQDWTC